METLPKLPGPRRLNSVGAKILYIPLLFAAFTVALGVSMRFELDNVSKTAQRVQSGQSPAVRISGELLENIRARQLLVKEYDRARAPELLEKFSALQGQFQTSSANAQALFADDRQQAEQLRSLAKQSGVFDRLFTEEFVTSLTEEDRLQDQLLGRISPELSRILQTLYSQTRQRSEQAQQIANAVARLDRHLRNAGRFLKNYASSGDRTDRYRVELELLASKEAYRALSFGPGGKEDMDDNPRHNCARLPD